MSALSRTGGSIKFTPRQCEVMANLSRITTDGSRHEPQFRLDGKNVSPQVRSLCNHGLIELKDGRLTKVEQESEIQRVLVDTGAAVAAMRELLGYKS